MIKIIGFKLVEVMVTLVIAKTELARIAQLQEMFFIDNRANGSRRSYRRYRVHDDDNQLPGIFLLFSRT